MSRTVDQGTTEVQDGRIFYETTGEGPCVVFLHAGIADRRMWDREFDLVGQEHWALRFDLRGFGRSPPAQAPYSPVQDLLDLLDRLGIERSFLVGASRGGRIALDFALEHADRVDGLLLAAPGLSGWRPGLDPDGQAAFDEDERRSAAITAAWLAGNRDEATERLRQLWCPALEGPGLDLFRRMVAENVEEVFDDRSERLETPIDPPAVRRLAKVAVPTTVLIGDRDNATMGHLADRISREIPGARRAKIVGADHLLNLSGPAAFEVALREDLARIVVRGRA